MGLLTNSEEFREQLINKNVYKPNSIYDLTNDNVTKALNILDDLGLSIRSNVIVRILEAQVDNTPLVQISNQRLLKEFTRRTASNIIKENLPIVSLGNILDKDPTTKPILKQEDFKITSDFKRENTLDGIINTLKTGFGYNGSRTALDKENLSYLDYYRFLGEGQKKVLNNNILRNYYNGYLPKTKDTKNTINFYLDDRDLPQDSINTYTKTGLPLDQEFDFIADGKEGTEGIASHISRGDTPELAQDSMGFGRTEQKGASGDSGDKLIWGESLPESLNIKRGLLHYTNQIINQDLKVSRNANMTVKNGFTDYDGNAYFKGVECRSWTVNDKYNTYSKLIRNRGNNVDFSVLKESVIPRQHPLKTDSREDKKRYLFSIENLAWTKQDLLDIGIDENHPEHGYHNGRLMWFPFYGISYTESTDVTNNSVNFLGRIEPVYTYANRIRKGTLNFLLIMDYPPNIESFRGNEANFFRGCNVDYTSNDIVIEGGNTVEEQSTITTGVTRQVEQQINTPRNFIFYFENDSSFIDTNYEATKNGALTNDQSNLYGLNENYLNQLENVVNFLSSEDLEYVNINIKGFTSKLSTNNYNARLGFQRGFSLLEKSLKDANVFNKLQYPDNFVDKTFDTYRNKQGEVLNITNDNLDKITFIFKIGDTEISLTSQGENTAQGGTGIDSQDRTNEVLNNSETKRDRRAEMSFTAVRKKYGTETIPEEITVNQIREKTQEELQRDTEIYGDYRENLYPFEKRDIVSNTPISHGYDNIKYFQPSYHSQTPEDFHKRLTFLEQMTSVGKSINQNNGSNSVFGKMPVCILRLGDFLHTKIIINSITKEIGDEYPWDMNPEGMGFQPMVARITMNFDIIGGQSLETPINSLQRAIDFNFYANSTFYGSSYYGGRPKSASNEELNFQKSRNSE